MQYHITPQDGEWLLEIQPLVVREDYKYCWPRELRILQTLQSPGLHVALRQHVFDECGQLVGKIIVGVTDDPLREARNLRGLHDIMIKVNGDPPLSDDTRRWLEAMGY